MDYTIPPQTKIGHIHLKVSDLNRSLRFYRDLLGFEVTQQMGDSAAFLSAGGYHHHIGLNTWMSKGMPVANRNHPGLFHVAILYPSRKELAIIVKRIIEAGYPLTGTADHGVSEAIYLNDPDENGIELYWDRPRELWPKNSNAELRMVTDPLNLETLLELAI